MNLAYTLINLANACTITSRFPLRCNAESVFRKAIDISTVMALTKLVYDIRTVACGTA